MLKKSPAVKAMHEQRHKLMKKKAEYLFKTWTAMKKNGKVLKLAQGDKILNAKFGVSINTPLMGAIYRHAQEGWKFNVDEWVKDHSKINTSGQNGHKMTSPVKGIKNGSEIVLESRASLSDDPDVLVAILKVNKLLISSGYDPIIELRKKVVRYQNISIAPAE